MPCYISYIDNDIYAVWIFYTRRFNVLGIIINKTEVDKMPSVVKYARNVQERNVMNVKNTGHTLISYALNLLGIVVMLYIGFKYINSSNEQDVAFARYSLLLGIFGILGFFVIDYFDNRQINLKPKTFAEFDTTRFLIVTVVLFFISMIIDAVMKLTIRYALSDTDMVLYYVFAGVCEEAFFRACIINGIIGGLTKKGKRPNFFVIITALMVSSVAFMMSHLQVYGTNMPMLMSTLAGGFILGGFYVIFRDIGANMIAHSVKNAYGYINLVRFGG